MPRWCLAQPVLSGFFVEGATANRSAPRKCATTQSFQVLSSSNSPKNACGNISNCVNRPTDPEANQGSRRSLKRCSRGGDPDDPGLEIPKKGIVVSPNLPIERSPGDGSRLQRGSCCNHHAGFL